MNIAAFEAPHADLTAAFQRLASVSTNSKTVPILSQILVEAMADNTVKMTATDLETCIITSFDAAVEIPGSEKIRSVRMEIANDTMVLTLPRSEFGDAREELHCSYDGPPLSVGFASLYLAGVSKLVEAEDLDMFFDAEQPAEKPLICRDASDPSALFMITPYRM
ncbi:hypothetical protein [Loktanella sp. M215]|uniref:hypothetical protein n=1 Tax=Loktanella sp. M215 TaxID=2675431 RepID=UPI001F2F5435|nr:hypothetical protein [Loktanella sp. M215]MCF7699920.1 hypothetical protein [Loktanella sp. M215]